MSYATARDFEAQLPRPPGTVRRWVANHPRTVDIAILVCYLIGALPLATFDITTVALELKVGNVPFLAGYTTVVAIRIIAGSIALLIRRKAPFLGLIILVVALIGEVGALSAANGVALCFLIYAVPVYKNVRSGWIGYGIATLGSVVSGLFEPVLNDISFFGDVTVRDLAAGAIASAVWFLVVLLIGINLGNRRRYLQAIIDRANQLARERDQLAQLAVAEERSRLARELHDIVAHSVSVMIALSEGAARAIEAAPDEAANAMRRSAETGRTALTEMRRLLGALQSSESAELAPQPDLSDIPELLQGFEDAGLSVSFVGAKADHGDRLQGLAMYRVVQEGLTNVLRYAGKGAHVDVSIEDTDGVVTVAVRDFGRAPGTAGPTTGVGSGRGLAGLAERVRVFGGHIESGPVLGESGWLLKACFPSDPEDRLQNQRTP